MRLITPVIVLAALLSSGCASRRLAFRYTHQNGAAILIPPGIKDPAVSRRSFTLPAESHASSSCNTSTNGVSLRVHRRTLRVTVDREPLLHNAPGAIATWAGSFEQQGCVAPGAGSRLALRITQAVPMDPNAADRLLHADPVRGRYVDLDSNYRLKVISPIVSDGAASTSLISDPISITGHGRSIQVDAKASSALIGYETAWYALSPRQDGPGLRVIPASIESHINATVQREASPRTNYFQFGPSAAYYRMFFLTRISQADHDIAVLAAPTRDALDAQTAKFEADPSLCASAEDRMCVVIPGHTAVSPHVAVVVNGKEVAVPVGARLRAVTPPRKEAILRTLTVRRLYNGSLIPVDFDRTDAAIFDLPLTGGEEIRW